MVLGIAIPLTLTDLTGMIVAQGDVWVVGASGPWPMSASYGAASRLVIMMSLPLVFVMNGVVAPMIAELWTEGTEAGARDHVAGRHDVGDHPFGVRIRRRLSPASRSCASRTDPVRGGGHILAILAFGVSFGVAAGSCNFALIMTGHHRVVAMVSAVTLLVAIGGEIIGVQFAGMTGIAIVDVVGQHGLPERVAHRDGEEADRHLDPGDTVAAQGPRVSRPTRLTFAAHRRTSGSLHPAPASRADRSNLRTGSRAPQRFRGGIEVPTAGEQTGRCRD